MRDSLFKLILQYVDQLLKSVTAIGFYDHVIADIERQMAEVQPIYDDFKAKTDDQKHFSQLSPPEQQALGQNEINFKHLLRQMNETVSTLIGRKWTNNITAALWCLDDLILTLEDVLSLNVTDTGKHIVTKDLVPKKRFAKADYLGRLAIVQTAISVLRDEVTEEANYGDEGTGVDDVDIFAWSINNSLGKTFLLLQRELVDVETNGLPTLHDFPRPPIVEPEIPDAPIPEKQPKAKLEVVEKGPEKKNKLVKTEA